MKTLFIILCVLFCSNVMAADIVLQNDTEKTSVVLIYWVDHTWKNYPYPANIGGAEIAPGKEFVMDNDYSGRMFVIIWNDTIIQTIELEDSDFTIYSKPSGYHVERGRYK